MESQVTLNQLLLYMLLKGLPVFLAGRALQILLLYVYKAPVKLSIAVLLISQIVTLALEITIWYFFKTNPMFHFISMPAVIGELILIAATFIFVRSTSKKWA